MKLDRDTITACATAPGKGGIGVVRISGSKSLEIVRQITLPTFKQLIPRKAQFFNFTDHQKNIIDHGLVVYFPAPNSFTGEDVIELQGHGSPVVMDLLVESLIHHGARLASPGEFSERAFLNDKLDLAQAEAIADLIDSGSQAAARSAMRSLQGEFSKLISNLIEQLIRLRVYIEAAIDFPEEEIDYLGDEKLKISLNNIINQVQCCLDQAQQGVLLKEGLHVVIAGKPNAGKSSLLNRLAGDERAIVTAIPGTTRDVLRETIHIDGLPIHIIDTAGLRISDDVVEQEGIRRAWLEIEKADLILLVVDASEIKNNNFQELWPFPERQPDFNKVLVIQNKMDLVDSSLVGIIEENHQAVIKLSAKSGEGIIEFKNYLKQRSHYHPNESSFSARRRHVSALQEAHAALLTAKNSLAQKSGELFAEDLRLTQAHLGKITGVVTADDLLGEIFSSFCIGK